MIIELCRLTQDVEIKTISTKDTKEIAVLNNRIAITHNKNITSFIDITAWGELAKFIGKYFRKGDELFIEGSIRNTDYPVGEKTIQMPYILVESVKFTYGNKK